MIAIFQYHTKHLTDYLDQKSNTVKPDDIVYEIFSKEDTHLKNEIKRTGVTTYMVKDFIVKEIFRNSQKYKDLFKEFVKFQYSLKEDEEKKKKIADGSLQPPPPPSLHLMAKEGKHMEISNPITHIQLPDEEKDKMEKEIDENQIGMPDM